jgi:enterochelin esterase family protein
MRTLAALPATVLLLSPAAAAGAGELRADLAMPSDALGQPLAYSVYLPDNDEPDARFPVIYLLHGYGASQHEWPQAGRIAETLDRMIASGEIAPVIAVMPDAGKSWYVDSARFGGPGDYETAITRDLVAGIDAAYPTRAEAGARGIAGNSMGGHGALRLAFGHPDTFSAVAALSPAIWMPDGISWISGPIGETEDERRRWYPRTTGETFDMGTFKAQSPFAMLDDVAAMAVPPAVLLAVGDDDYWDLQDGTVEMYVELRRIGLEPELRVGDGGHDWAYWGAALPDVLRFFDAAFGPGE